jgi:hypothetical protein
MNFSNVLKPSENNGYVEKKDKAKKIRHLDVEYLDATNFHHQVIFCKEISFLCQEKLLFIKTCIVLALRNNLTIK